MTPDPSPRQVLYAIVSAMFGAVVVILIVGAAVAGLVPVWWTVTMSLATALLAFWGVRSWRRTGPLLATSIALFVLWTVGTILIGG